MKMEQSKNISIQEDKFLEMSSWNALPKKCNKLPKVKDTSFKCGTPIYQPNQNKSMLELDLSMPSNVYIKIYNIDGYLIKELDEKQFEAGKHTYDIDTSELLPDIYFISCGDDSTCFTRRLAIQ